MGPSSSKLDKVLADTPDDERCYGLENFGNTCYCNSVLQALYFCKPFRERVLAYAAALPKDGGEENLLIRLAELFVMVGGSRVHRFSIAHIVLSMKGGEGLCTIKGSCMEIWIAEKRGDLPALHVI